MRGPEVMVNRRLRLSWMGHGEFYRDLSLWAYVEMPAGGSMSVLMPVKMRSCNNNDITPNYEDYKSAELESGVRRSSRLL